MAIIVSLYPQDIHWVWMALPESKSDFIWKEKHNYNLFCYDMNLWGNSRTQYRQR